LCLFFPIWPVEEQLAIVFVLMQEGLKIKDNLNKQSDEEKVVKVKYEFTESDYVSAFTKLTEAAVRYDKNAAGAIGLDAFEA
jgi:hypothetical protein